MEAVEMKGERKRVKKRDIQRERESGGGGRW